MDKLRTARQNRALHLMFRQLADELNDRGLDMKTALQGFFEIPWNEHTIKEAIWRPIQIKQVGKESTTALTTKEIDMVFETIAMFMAKRHGLVLEFPSFETILERQRLMEGPPK